MPLTSRTTGYRSEGFSFFRNKNEGVMTRRPPPKTTPSRHVPNKPREKPIRHFTKPLLHHNQTTAARKRRDKYDKEPLLKENKTEDRMRLAQSLEAYKKRITETGDDEAHKSMSPSRSPNKPMCSLVKSSPVRMRSSEDSTHFTATTASASSGSSSGGSIHSGTTISPPLSPVSNRTNDSNMELVPFDEEQQVEDLNRFCADIFAKYDVGDEASTTVLVAYNGGVEVVPEEYPIIPEDGPLDLVPHQQQEGPTEETKSQTSEDEGMNPASYLLKLVEECEARWTSYTQSMREMTTLLPVLSKAFSDDSSTSRDSSSGRPSSDPATQGQIVQRQQEEIDYRDPATQGLIIQRQQEEIEYLRAQLLREREALLQEEEACDRLYPAPMEHIDAIPLEEIEVAVDEEDNVSVTSAMTELNDAPKDNDSESVFAAVPLSRPDAAASVSGDDGVLTTKHVHNMPLKLSAANGTMRRALYTGPCTGGVCTGVGRLRFETGDTYSGQVVNGKMHGRGTYTFSKRRLGNQILRGSFENNVYVGSKPDPASHKLGTKASF